MTRPRPHIPLSVRVQVAGRQMHAVDPKLAASIAYGSKDLPLGRRLDRWLQALRAALSGDVALDHDPALILRGFKIDRRKPPAAWYTPNANDPDHLIYRVKDDHLQKTTGRKPGAERTVTTKGSDIGIKTKFARLERPKRRKQKISARKNPWPKRKFGK